MLNITSTRTSNGPTPGVERRRSRRREFHGSGKVTLFGNGKHDEWHCTGEVLNASPGGIACRTGSCEAGRLTAGRIVRAVFRVEEESEPFDFHARITNATQAGTPGYIIVGMEFLIDADRKKERSRLECALTAAVGSHDE